MEYMQTAINAALKGGRVLIFRFGSSNNVRFKDKINLVTDADLLSELAVVDVIQKSFPDHQIMGEEGLANGGDSDHKWIIDPLDGTTNYAHGYPVFSVSVALEIKGEVVVGAVYNPILKELFTAEKGKGAYLNEKRLKVSSTDKLIDSLLSTGFPYVRMTGGPTNLEYFNKAIMNCQEIRRDGSAALDLCYVAAGRFDGFWELMLKPWDDAAGMLVLTEAGGKVTDMKGGPYSIYSDEIMATNGLIHKELMDVLNSAV
jgi:myo-inositol-1(or 4)-monophosphatase